MEDIFLKDHSKWLSKYGNLVNYSENKMIPINRWYPLLEGFSFGFVESIISEQKKIPKLCFDPFSGGGTTPLVAQINNISCISFEVSPFLSQVCRAKLRLDYCYREFKNIIDILEEKLFGVDSHGYIIQSKTFKKKKNLKKWLFHKTALDSLLCIRKTIDCFAPEKYLDLFYVILASISLEFSNVYRDGKALRYKQGWEKRFYTRRNIYNTFLSKCRNEILSDIEVLEFVADNIKVENYKNFYCGDSRHLVNRLDNDSIDLAITSPPYLNSRDYTDSQIIELWLLGHVKSYEELRALREKTLRSHVQINWEESKLPDSKSLQKSFYEIMKYKDTFWNRSIPSMISGYFNDINNILLKLKEKMSKGGKMYINVANSSYYGVVIETDKIISELAQNLEYDLIDIRIARKIKSSSQQQKKVGSLRESVVVLQNNKGRLL
jgi:methylase of polypeptide subunit release factors